MPYSPSMTSYHTMQEAVRSKEVHSNLIPVCVIISSVFTTLLGTTEELPLGNMHVHRTLTFPIWMMIETLRTLKQVCRITIQNAHDRPLMMEMMDLTKNGR